MQTSLGASGNRESLGGDNTRCCCETGRNPASFVPVRRRHRLSEKPVVVFFISNCFATDLREDGDRQSSLAFFHLVSRPRK